MRWTLLVCTAGTYIILLLALSERQVSAGADRLYRTSVLSVDGKSHFRRLLNEAKLSRNMRTFFSRTLTVSWRTHHNGRVRMTSRLESSVNL
jgi:hypothetical protein